MIRGEIDYKINNWLLFGYVMNWFFLINLYRLFIFYWGFICINDKYGLCFLICEGKIFVEIDECKVFIKVMKIELFLYFSDFGYRCLKENFVINIVWLVSFR